jgi:dihydrofolate synthase/folylpolyglutamate synthase
MKDKDARGMLCALAPRAARFHLTRAETPRAADPVELAAVASRAVPHVAVETHGNARDALRQAIDGGPAEAVVCAAGSIFLIGELRAALVGDA